MCEGQKHVRTGTSAGGAAGIVSSSTGGLVPVLLSVWAPARKIATVSNGTRDWVSHVELAGAHARSYLDS